MTEQLALHSPEFGDSFRLLHGRGGCYEALEQVTIDVFFPLVLVTFYKASEDISDESTLVQSLSVWLKQQPQLTGITALAVQRRYLADTPVSIEWGEAPERLYASEQSLRFQLSIERGQNTGFFLDMAPGRRWLRDHAQGRRVLNLFAYTCAFSVVACQAGAESVVNVDMSSAALARGRDNHRLNGLSTERVRFLQENILKSWGRIRRPGPYDTIIIDPPSYQPGSFVAQRDYHKLIRRIPELLSLGGDVLLCLNAPELPPEFLHELMAEWCPDAEFVARLPSAAGFVDRDEQRQLKVLHYRFQ